MANETSYAALLSNGGRVAKLLSTLLHEKLHDPSDLRSLMTFVPWDGTSSDTMNVPTLNPALVMSAASSELSSGFANTALDTGNYDLVVARYGAVMEPTDLMALTGGVIDVEKVVDVLVGSAGQTMTNLLCSLFPNISTTVGTTTVDLSVDTWFDAKAALNLNSNPGPLGSVLSQKQYNDLIEDIRGITGPLSFVEATQEQLSTMGIGFKGFFAGVGIWQSDKVDTINAAADYAGAMFSMGAFAYTMADLRTRDNLLINPQDILAATEDLFVERSRDAINGKSQLIVNMYPAVAEQEDLRAVQIVSAV